MKSFPVLEIIQSLPKERLKLLEKFMQSPFWVTHKGAMDFFGYLKNNLSDETAFDKDKIAQALNITPDRVYHLNNYVLEAVENFLACMEWNTEPHLQHLHTVRSLRQLNLEEPAEKMLRYARRELDSSPERSTDWLQTDYLWRLESFRTSRQQGRAKDFNLQDLANTQDIAFVAARLQTGCHAGNRKGPPASANATRFRCRGAPARGLRRSRSPSPDLLVAGYSHPPI